MMNEKKKWEGKYVPQKYVLLERKGESGEPIRVRLTWVLWTIVLAGFLALLVANLLNGWISTRQ